MYNYISLLLNNMTFVATTTSLLPMSNMVHGSCSSLMLVKMVQKGRKGRVLLMDRTMMSETFFACSWTALICVQLVWTLSIGTGLGEEIKWTLKEGLNIDPFPAFRGHLMSLAEGFLLLLLIGCCTTSAWIPASQEFFHQLKQSSQKQQFLST